MRALKIYRALTQADHGVRAAYEARAAASAPATDGVVAEIAPDKERRAA